MTDPVDPHQRSKDETINIALIHHHVNSNTPSGVKIRQAFPFIPTFDSTVKSGANRSIHHDLQIQIPESGSNLLKTVEFKGSQYFKPIDNSKPPWFNGVQFYNGTGSKLSIGHKYARDFYDIALDEIIQGLNIQTPKPTYEVWVKDAFRQGRPSTPFVCEIREKGYGGEFLSNCRKKFNKQFNVGDKDLLLLMREVQQLVNESLGCKDYWLQIHGDIDNPESFHVKWSEKISPSEIQQVIKIKSKNDCDINFKFVCDDGMEFYAKLRWGYGQCITNIRVDIK